MSAATQQELGISARIALACRELAGGAEPSDHSCGICRNVFNLLHSGSDDDDFIDDLYARLGYVFVAFGMDKEYPLGMRARVDGDCWAEPHGTARRELAMRVAKYLEASAS